MYALRDHAEKGRGDHGSLMVGGLNVHVQKDKAGGVHLGETVRDRQGKKRRTGTDRSQANLKKSGGGVKELVEGGRIFLGAV